LAGASREIRWGGKVADGLLVKKSLLTTGIETLWLPKLNALSP
jgi:hypothetical protein